MSTDAIVSEAFLQQWSKTPADVNGVVFASIDALAEHAAAVLANNTIRLIRTGQDLKYAPIGFDLYGNMSAASYLGYYCKLCDKNIGGAPAIERKTHKQTGTGYLQVSCTHCHKDVEERPLHFL